MKIGMSLTTSYSIQRDSRELVTSLIEQVELMAALGFDSLSLGDHHLTNDHYVQVMPAISRMAGISGDMQLLPLFLLPFYNPVLLAEQMATLDVITGGRTAMICGLGYDPAAFIAFQTTQRVRVPRFVESFEILRALMSGDDVTYQGRHYTINQGIRINPKPLQQTLPMWIAAGAEPAVRRAAKMADGWTIVPGWGLPLIKERLQTYRSALAEFGRSEESNEVVLRRDIHLAPTSEAASREAATLFEHGYRGQSAGELQQSLVVGGPAECIELLEQFEELGISRVLFRCALDEKEQALQTIRLLGEEVIPHFASNS
jgi:alkanesulfonate monooxygenase SsuD/methylene tetrahydromethanopterin reductase-like flavin-dependent oxidoreductase (luciferase family)